MRLSPEILYLVNAVVEHIRLREELNRQRREFWGLAQNEGGEVILQKE